MQYIKLAIIFTLRIIFRAFHIFPVCENRIVFVSFMGKQFSCNPKYLFEYIYGKYGNKYRYVWCLNDKLLFSDKHKNIKIVKFISFKYVWHILTSKFIITNNHVEPVFPFRKEQIIINTWHGGGAYKRISALVSLYEKRRPYSTILRNIRAKLHNYYIIAACEKFKNCIAEDWVMPTKKFLSIGMPRNDILFSNNPCKEKVKSFYNLDHNIRIILYAPTYRGLPSRPDSIGLTLKIEDLLKNTKIKFNKDFILLYRTHHDFNLNDNINGIITATNYPDMQELLCAADILITDYSSSMWDFSLTFKPCFLYAPDVKKYQDEQEFYTPIEEWPFPLAKTNEQLMENIIKFDEEKYKQAVKKHHEDLGSYETGTACEQFCNLVLK